MYSEDFSFWIVHLSWTNLFQLLLSWTSFRIISVIEHRFYNLSAWERREEYQRTFYSTLLVDRRTGHVCFKKSVSIILFHVGYLFPRYYLYAKSNLVFMILIKKDPSQKSINRFFKNVLSFKSILNGSHTSQISKILKYYIYIR